MTISFHLYWKLYLSVLLITFPFLEGFSAYVGMFIWWISNIINHYLLAGIVGEILKLKRPVKFTQRVLRKKLKRKSFLLRNKKRRFQRVFLWHREQRREKSKRELLYEKSLKTKVSFLRLSLFVFLKAGIVVLGLSLCVHLMRDKLLMAVAEYLLLIFCFIWILKRHHDGK